MQNASIETAGDAKNTIAPLPTAANVGNLTENLGRVGAMLRPEFLRLPKPGTLCPFSGLSRSYLNSLILGTEANGHRPLVKSICLRQRGAKRGVRLIVAEDLISFLRAHLETGATVSEPEATPDAELSRVLAEDLK